VSICVGRSGGGKSAGTLFVHAFFYSVFVFFFGGVVEGSAEAGGF